jgi:branched-chain amino acid transport system ATP-binding protein
LGIARALSIRPRFVLLDEPAAGLDEEESKELVTMLREVRDRFELGLVVIEHDVPLIMSLCERVHVLDHGVTLAVGPPREIARDSRVMTAYLGDAVHEARA